MHNGIEVEECYGILWEVCRDESLSGYVAYRQMRELLERLCRMSLTDDKGSLQMTDLSARISFVSSKLGLTLTEQDRLHTLRMTSNDILNHRVKPVREQLLRDAKTLAFFVKRLTGADIPSRLYALLPHADATYLTAAPSVGRQVKRMRVIFQYADDFFLYVESPETVGAELLRVRYNIPQVNDEFKETCRVLWRHAQLNLLDVSVDEENVLTPSFIILEPDYLIDISSLAECFKEYGHHPMNYVLARFQPTGNTRPLLLGNIVNLFLDEWIHAKGVPDYLACMKKAFRAYPIELAACEDLLDREKEAVFFADCKRHFEHIRKTVSDVFPAPGYALDKTDAVLEPSYICEALGLQGRLDYMQRDMTSFIEMKSGKADEYSMRGKVEPKENNRVQMLLYQAVLEYSMGMDHRQVKAYLFYTRYPLLYPARSSWAMVRRIMDVRNRIVANEYGIQLRNTPSYTSDFLKSITPALLNERGLTGVLWTRYQRPGIEEVVGRIRSLSSIEETYFCSLYNFITKELYTSKSGDAEYEGHFGASSLWLSTLEEKREAGEILYDLSIVQNHAADEHKPFLVLSVAGQEDGDDGACILPNFREGDAVVLYERNAETDNVTNKMVFKGNIEYFSETFVRVRLRASQQNAGVLPSDSCYAIEHDYMDTSFRSMYNGLTAFLSATPRRRDLLLGQRLPEFDTVLDSRIAEAADDFARIALKAEAARDYFLLVGPPGTGKTSRALRAMVGNFYRQGKQVLLLSYTNRAVDEICKMLVGISPAVDFIRIGSELACEPAYRPYLVENVLEACANRCAVQERLGRCQIFVGTVATLSSKTDLFRLKTFDVAIVDEATQILEPQLLGLLCARGVQGGDAIGKFVLIGDHKQLPAVVLQSSAQSEVHDEALRGIGLYNLKDSLFERLYRYVTCLKADAVVAGLPLSVRCHDMLRRQGRMNIEVARFPNQAFYGNQLEILGLPHQQGALALASGLESDEFAPLLTRRVAFLPSQPEPLSGSPKVNHSEACLVARLAVSVYKQYSASGQFDVASTLGIIAPYRSQIALIKRELEASGVPQLGGVMVDTVERFQGSERDVIIYSFCLNRTYQLKFLANVTEDNGVLVDRKLNVALTRARKQMFVTGVPDLLNLNPIYARLLQVLQEA